VRLRKGVIDKVVNTANLQTATVHKIADELDSGVERYQQYGISTSPNDIAADGKGSEVILADALDANNAVIIATDDRRYRPVVANPGDVQIYHYKDDPETDATDALARITFTDDAGDDYRLIAKLNQCVLEMKSTNEITIPNENANIVIDENGSITLNGKAMVINVEPLDINES
jgi:phage gp45-like